MSSNGKALTIPFADDDSGPVSDLVPTPYRGVYNSWLSNFTVSNSVAHLFYVVGAQPREIYQRVSMDSITTSINWGISGECVIALDGFFTRDPSNPSTLYAIGGDATEQNAQGMPIIVLKSTDNGMTWAEYAKSSQLYHPYALGGARHINGHGITGAFTNQIDSSGALNAQQVYYFGLPAN